MELIEVRVAADMLGSGIEVRVADDPERHLVMVLPTEIGLSEKLVKLFDRGNDASMPR